MENEFGFNKYEEYLGKMRKWMSPEKSLDIVKANKGYFRALRNATTDEEANRAIKDLDTNVMRGIIQSKSDKLNDDTYYRILKDFNLYEPNKYLGDWKKLKETAKTYGNDKPFQLDEGALRSWAMKEGMKPEDLKTILANEFQKNMNALGQKYKAEGEKKLAEERAKMQKDWDESLAGNVVGAFFPSINAEGREIIGSGDGDISGKAVTADIAFNTIEALNPLSKLGAGVKIASKFGGTTGARLFGNAIEGLVQGAGAEAVRQGLSNEEMNAGKIAGNSLSEATIPTALQGSIGFLRSIPRVQKITRGISKAMHSGGEGDEAARLLTNELDDINKAQKMMADKSSSVREKLNASNPEYAKLSKEYDAGRRNYKKNVEADIEEAIKDADEYTDGWAKRTGVPVESPMYTAMLKKNREDYIAKTKERIAEEIGDTDIVEILSSSKEEYITKMLEKKRAEIKRALKLGEDGSYDVMRANDKYIGGQFVTETPTKKMGIASSKWDDVGNTKLDDFTNSVKNVGGRGLVIASNNKAKELDINVAGVNIKVPKSKINKPSDEELKQKELEEKQKKWAKGYVNWDDLNTPEYKAWAQSNLNKMMGVE